MQKNSFKQIQCKPKIVYEEDYSTNQTDFNTQLIHQDKGNHRKNHKRLTPISNYKILRSNLLRHNAIHEKDINILIINDLSKKKSSHCYTFIYERFISLILLKRYYSLSEGKDRLPKLCRYYKHYLTLLMKPIMTCYYTNNLIQTCSHQKAELYWLNTYANKSRESTLSNKENDIPIPTIFDFETKESIDRISTTLTCESNEQLRYPEEMIRTAINKIQNSISKHKTDLTLLSETHINLNKSRTLLSDISILSLMKNFRRPSTIRRSKHLLTASGEVKFDYMVRTKKTLLKSNTIVTGNIEKVNEKINAKRISFISQASNIKPQQRKSFHLSNNEAPTQLKMSKTINTHMITKSTINTNSNKKTGFDEKFKKRCSSKVENKLFKSIEIKNYISHKSPNELSHLFPMQNLHNTNTKMNKHIISKSKSPLKTIKRSSNQSINTAMISSQQLMSYNNTIQGCYKDIYNKKRDHFLHNK